MLRPHPESRTASNNQSLPAALFNCCAPIVCSFWASFQGITSTTCLSLRSLLIRNAIGFWLWRQLLATINTIHQSGNLNYFTSIQTALTLYRMLRPATPLTLLLFIAFVLLLISVISTPIVKSIPLASYAGVDFGVFGNCEGSKCTDIKVGYTTGTY